ncbi:hypothetical protein Syun_016857 [Stephania yunnanensis]|uniref:Uncharacterized protein n=1 Tax=Stephania yunnanensis TaxID=152371 RepID=A0AAP0J6T2_9MAGN
MDSAAGVDSRRWWHSSRWTTQAARADNEPARGSGSGEPPTQTNSSGSGAVNGVERRCGGGYS